MRTFEDLMLGYNQACKKAGKGLWISGRNLMASVGNLAAEIMLWRYLLYAPEGSLKFREYSTKAEIFNYLLYRIGEYGFHSLDFRFQLNEHRQFFGADQPFFLLGKDTTFPFGEMGETNHIDTLIFPACLQGVIMSKKRESQKEQHYQRFLKGEYEYDVNYWKRFIMSSNSFHPSQEAEEDTCKKGVWADLFNNFVLAGCVSHTLTPLEYELILLQLICAEGSGPQGQKVRFLSKGCKKNPEEGGRVGAKKKKQNPPIYINFGDRKLCLPVPITSVQVFLGRVVYHLALEDSWPFKHFEVEPDLSDVIRSADSREHKPVIDMRGWNLEDGI